MARLPLPGQDSGTWGDLLNDYLIQSHKADGQLRDGSVTSATITDGSVTSNTLADGAVTNAKVSSLSADKITSGTLPTGRIPDLSATYASTEAVGLKLDATNAAVESHLPSRLSEASLNGSYAGLGALSSKLDATTSAVSAVLPTRLSDATLNATYATVTALGNKLDATTAAIEARLPSRLSDATLGTTYAATSALATKLDATTPAVEAVLPTRLQDSSLKAAYVPFWQANTTYIANAVVVSPTGRLVTAITGFTSGSAYAAGNWVIVADASYIPKPIAAGTTGQVLTVQSDGSLAYASTVARQVVEHGSVAATIRPTTSGPVSWIGSVQPINWLDGDDWFEATVVVVDIPTLNLVNYWRAEDLGMTSGQAVTTMANRVSGGPSLTAAGGPVFNIESSMSSVLLDGVDDQLSETTTSLAQPSTVISVGRFVVTAASKPWVSSASTVHAITVTSGSKWSANAGTSLAHTTSVDTGWHVIAAVFNGATTIISVDGVAVSGAGGSNARAGNRIGANSGATTFSNMKITMVAEYSTALTTSDLDSIRTTLRTRYPILP